MSIHAPIHKVNPITLSLLASSRLKNEFNYKFDENPLLGKKIDKRMIDP